MRYEDGKTPFEEAMDSARMLAIAMGVVLAWLVIGGCVIVWRVLL